MNPSKTTQHAVLSRLKYFRDTLGCRVGREIECICVISDTNRAEQMMLQHVWQSGASSCVSGKTGRRPGSMTQFFVLSSKRPCPEKFETIAFRPTSNNFFNHL